MKLKRIIEISSATAIAIGSIVAFAAPASAATDTYYKWTGTASTTAGLAGCTLNCWSVAGNWKVSTDGGTTYVNATTAPISTDNSGAGDNLVFDATSLTSYTTLNDDISNLTVNTITDQGTNTNDYGFNINGNAITLVGGITAYNTSSPSLSLSNAVTFSSSQTFGDATTGSSKVSLDGALTIPQGVTVTIAASGYFVPSSLSGAGSIVVSAQLTSKNYPEYLSFYNSSPNFTGSIEMQSGSILEIGKTDSLGTSSVKIDEGAQLEVQDQPTGSPATDTFVIPNALTIGGNAAAVSNQYQGAIIAGLYDSAKGQYDGALTVNLTGPVTLTSDTTVASSYATSTTYNVTGTLNSNGHKFSAVSKSQPTYGDASVLVNGQAVAGVAANGAGSVTAKAPGTPDTGLALTAARPAIVAVTTIIASAGLLVAARRSRVFSH